ncbi:hypothetical protein NIES25_54410 (plasmid) [Nostoc linckia NIES-25]|nr:hypothetical protein NIES25_54410 [Nostoc linckia NIES-25]
MTDIELFNTNKMTFKTSSKLDFIHFFRNANAIAKTFGAREFYFFQFIENL